MRRRISSRRSSRRKRPTAPVADESSTEHAAEQHQPAPIVEARPDPTRVAQNVVSARVTQEDLIPTFKIKPVLPPQVAGPAIERLKMGPNGTMEAFTVKVLSLHFLFS